MNNLLFFKISNETTHRVATSSGRFGDWWKRKDGYPPHPVGDFLAGTSGDYKKWPDFMSCGTAVSFIVTEKVVSDLHNADIAVEVGPVILTCTVGPLVPPPKYFYLCAPNGVEMDEGKGQIGLSIPVKPDTWNGSDFCTTATRPLLLFCSYRVVELAREKKWTNCSFQFPARYADGVPIQSRKLDHLAKKKDWPPTWLKELL